MSRGNADYFFTSESVSEGHPDKVCDQISDAILDALLAQDKHSRVAVESLCKTGLVVIAGEVTTKAQIDYAKVAREMIQEIGYTDGDLGFDAKSCGVITAIEQQSPDISMGVTASGNKERGHATSRRASSTVSTTRVAPSAPRIRSGTPR